MPSTTFLRLNDKKRKRFIQEAYIEFSLNQFNGASVTNLVKTLGIAKGSVYQYFSDKEALYKFLVTESIQHLDHLLDKACPYHGEAFYDWYTKLVIVEVKFFLSFPAYSLLLRNLNQGVSKIDIELRTKIHQARSNRINKAIQSSLDYSEMNKFQLTQASLWLFTMITRDLDLAPIIKSGDPIYLESTELVDVCSAWVENLKSGL